MTKSPVKIGLSILPHARATLWGRSNEACTGLAAHETNRAGGSDELLAELVISDGGALAQQTAANLQYVRGPQGAKNLSVAAGCLASPRSVVNEESRDRCQTARGRSPPVSITLGQSCYEAGHFREHLLARKAVRAPPNLQRNACVSQPVQVAAAAGMDFATVCSPAASVAASNQDAGEGAPIGMTRTLHAASVAVPPNRINWNFNN